MDLSQFELTETEVEELTRQCQERSMSSLAAFYHLFLFEVCRSVGCFYVSQSND